VNIPWYIRQSRFFVNFSHTAARSTKLPETGGILDNETQTAVTASLYILTFLFLGAANDVTSRRVNDSCSWGDTLDLSVLEIFEIFISKMSTFLHNCPVYSDILRTFQLKFLVQTPFSLPVCSWTSK
jgi:hypothetical protein